MQEEDEEEEDDKAVHVHLCVALECVCVCVCKLKGKVEEVWPPQSGAAVCNDLVSSLQAEGVDIIREWLRWFLSIDEIWTDSQLQFFCYCVLAEFWG